MRLLEEKKKAALEIHWAGKDWETKKKEMLTKGYKGGKRIGWWSMIVAGLLNGSKDHLGLRKLRVGGSMKMLGSYEGTNGGWCLFVLTVRSVN